MGTLEERQIVRGLCYAREAASDVHPAMGPGMDRASSNPVPESQGSCQKAGFHKLKAVVAAQVDV